jgi:hypothetical protein
MARRLRRQQRNLHSWNISGSQIPTTLKAENSDHFDPVIDYQNALQWAKVEHVEEIATEQSTIKLVSSHSLAFVMPGAH